MSDIRTLWRESKVYRVVLVLAVIYTVFRLGVHGFYLATMLAPERLPDWVGAEEPMIPDDLRIYLDAAERLESREDLYIQNEVKRMEFYQYAPSFALAFVPTLGISRNIQTIFHTVLHIAVYVLLYKFWSKIFEESGLSQAKEKLGLTLPVWLIFSAFWGDLGYLNIYIILAFLSTLLIKAILNEKLGWSLLWLSLILQMKPQWAFAIAVPLLLGRWRFFLKVFSLSILVYLTIVGSVMLITGPDYGLQQYLDYFRLLGRVSGGSYPWRMPKDAFLGYNHSIMQVFIYLFGTQSWVFQLATAIKVLILTPLGILGIRFLRNPLKKQGGEVPRLALDWALTLYLAAFIWLDMVWEISLGIAIFSYLLGTLKQRSARNLVWIVFLPYALVDLIQVFSFAVFGPDVIATGLYVLTDPSIYVPLIMIVILLFYMLLIRRLWQTSNHLPFSKVV